MIPTSAATLRTVKMFCTQAPVRTPKTLIRPRNSIANMATSCCEEAVNAVGCPKRFTVPRFSRIFCAEIHGKKTPRNFPKATATAAIVPVWITRKSVQPYRNPNNGLNDSRR